MDSYTKTEKLWAAVLLELNAICDQRLWNLIFKPLLCVQQKREKRKKGRGGVSIEQVQSCPGLVCLDLTDLFLLELCHLAFKNSRHVPNCNELWLHCLDFFRLPCSKLACIAVCDYSEKSQTEKAGDCHSALLITRWAQGFIFWNFLLSDLVFVFSSFFYPIAFSRAKFTKVVTWLSRIEKNKSGTYLSLKRGSC